MRVQDIGKGVESTKVKEYYAHGLTVTPLKTPYVTTGHGSEAMWKLSGMF